MGDMCFYYAWKYGDYYCMKKEESIPDDLYQRYCKNYNYDDCPIYKGEESGGGCFLTSACVEAKGLPDDCYELTVLRRFRDTYLQAQPEGAALIQNYYDIAPEIVRKVNRRKEKDEIWEEIYRKMVEPCVALVEKGEFQKALDCYKKYTEILGNSI